MLAEGGFPSTAGSAASLAAPPSASDPRPRSTSGQSGSPALCSPGPAAPTPSASTSTTHSAPRPPHTHTGGRSSSSSLATSSGTLGRGRGCDAAALAQIQVSERELTTLVQTLGHSDAATVAKAEQLCKEYNDVAMRLISDPASSSSGQQPHSIVTSRPSHPGPSDTHSCNQAVQLLEKAQVLTEPGGVLSHDLQLQQRFQAVTFNNLGCYYKRKGKPEAALQFLERARDLEACLAASVSENPGGTLLNLCAVQSSMGRHTAALQSADSALLLLSTAAGLTQHEVTAYALHEAQAGSSGGRSSRSSSSGGAADSSADGGGGGGDGPVADALRRMRPSDQSVLAMAFYNQGVELEYLEQGQEALRAYGVAAGLAIRLLGKGSQVGSMFNKTLSNFRAQLRSKMSSRLGQGQGPRGASLLHRPVSASIYRPANSRPPERPASGCERGRHGGGGGSTALPLGAVAGTSAGHHEPQLLVVEEGGAMGGKRQQQHHLHPHGSATDVPTARPRPEGPSPYLARNTQSPFLDARPHLPASAGPINTHAHMPALGSGSGKVSAASRGRQPAASGSDDSSMGPAASGRVAASSSTPSRPAAPSAAAGQQHDGLDAEARLEQLLQARKQLALVALEQPQLGVKS